MFSAYLNCGPIFTVCSHTFIIFWLRKAFMRVETYQLGFSVLLNTCKRIMDTKWGNSPYLHLIQIFNFFINKWKWYSLKPCFFTVFKFWRHLYCVFTYIYSLLIEKGLYEGRNVSIKFPCVIIVLLHYFDGVFIAAQCSATFLDLLCSPECRYY